MLKTPMAHEEMLQKTGQRLDAKSGYHALVAGCVQHSEVAVKAAGRQMMTAPAGTTAGRRIA